MGPVLSSGEGPALAPRTEVQCVWGRRVREMGAGFRYSASRAPGEKPRDEKGKHGAGAPMRRKSRQHVDGQAGKHSRASLKARPKAAGPQEWRCASGPGPRPSDEKGHPHPRVWFVFPQILRTGYRYQPRLKDEELQLH